MSSARAVSQRESSDGSVHTILVVENEVLIRMPLAEYLRECGFRVFEATNVAEAKTVLDAGTLVDLVFTEVDLPGEENGFMLARWVRQHRPDTKVLLTSGIANSTQKAGDLCESGPMLAKPYQHGVVLQRIQALLRQAGKTAQTPE